MNLDFISKLAHLLFLEIRSPISLKSLPSLLRSIGKLKDVQIDVQSKKKDLFGIIKVIGFKEWNIFKNSQVVLETKNRNEVVNFFESLLDDRERI